MNKGTAKRMILLSSGAMVVITTVGTLSKKQELPSAKVPLGAFIAGVMLEVLAEFEPQIAGGLAVLALTTTVFVYGGPAFEALTKLTTPTDNFTTVGGGDFPNPPK